MSSSSHSFACCVRNASPESETSSRVLRPSSLPYPLLFQSFKPYQSDHHSNPLSHMPHLQTSLMPPSLLCPQIPRWSFPAGKRRGIHAWDRGLYDWRREDDCGSRKPYPPCDYRSTSDELGGSGLLPSSLHCLHCEFLFSSLVMY